MRNLEILLNGSVTLIDFDREAGETVQMFTVDELAHKLYLISSKNTLYAFSYSQLLPANSSKLLYQWEIFAGENATAVSIAYIQEISGLCIAFSNGTIIKHSNMSEAEGKYFQRYLYSQETTKLMRLHAFQIKLLPAHGVQMKSISLLLKEKENLLCIIPFSILLARWI